MIKLIVAIGPNGLIGKGDKMPWHIPEEFKHFKKTTLNSTLLMGKRTFEGLPRKLPDRKIYVLDYNEVPGADKTITSMEELKQLFDEYKNSEEILYIAGGKSIYEQFSQEADEWIVSEVETDVKGDVFLNLDYSNYNKELLKEEEKFKVYKYTRRNNE